MSLAHAARTPAGVGEITNEPEHGSADPKPGSVDPKLGLPDEDRLELEGLRPYIRREGENAGLHLLVEGVHCGACVNRIERSLGKMPEVAGARVNLSTRRLAVDWQGGDGTALAVTRKLAALGFPAKPYDPERLEASRDREEDRLLRAMAVAGFAAGNVMLLSVSVWAGHAFSMGEATRELLHWVSALVALPALVYAGRPFYQSAWSALRAGRTNMDVPITIGVVLAAAMSLHETAVGGEHAYFDSAISLVFFLLIGRYLERRARGKARAAAERLVALAARSVTLIGPDGVARSVAPEHVRPGDEVLVAAGERVPVDGVVLSGRSDLDTSLITGESVPRPGFAGGEVHAGTLNLTAPLRLRVKSVGEGTLLAEIVRLMEVAEARRGRFVGLAERVARLYAPFVHALALLTFLGWFFLIGVAWQQALLYAVAVLIITCPCALGLAVPAVQVIASGRLFRQGLLLKSATALERLAAVDTVVFDKTGTLTLDDLALLPDPSLSVGDLRLASSLAAASRHPLAKALRAAAPEAPAAEGAKEVPGSGMRLETPEGTVRLGSRAFVGVAEDASVGPELWLDRPNREPVRFAFADRAREDAPAVLSWLRRRGFTVELLSGDRRPSVEDLARRLGIARFTAQARPADKTARLEELAAQGRKVLMVGDGLNDAPALAAAHVSLSPSSAADVSANAADAVFQGGRLAPVVDLLATARSSERLVAQNIALAVGYNLVFVPLAVMGFVTPLVAAIAMSCSSLTVIGNALRLSLGRSEAERLPGHA